MKVYIAGAIGFFIGTFFGMFVLGLMQMVRKGDDIYEKLIVEQGRAKYKGKLCEPDNYFDYFNSHHDRRICPERRGQSGETGNSDHRVLHYVNGHLGISKGSGGKVNG